MVSWLAQWGNLWMRTDGAQVSFEIKYARRSHPESEKKNNPFDSKTFHIKDISASVRRDALRKFSWNYFRQPGGKL